MESSKVSGVHIVVFVAKMIKEQNQGRERRSINQSPARGSSIYTDLIEENLVVDLLLKLSLGPFLQLEGEKSRQNGVLKDGCMESRHSWLST